MAAIDKSLYEKMTITSVSGEKTADIKTGVISFNYYEDVFSPMILLEWLLSTLVILLQ